MNTSSQSAAWLGWVKSLPEELIRARPVLCTQIAWAFMDSAQKAGNYIFAIVSASGKADILTAQGRLREAFSLVAQVAFKTGTYARALRAGDEEIRVARSTAALDASWL